MSSKVKKVRIIVILVLLGTAALVGNNYRLRQAAMPKETVDISGVVEFRKTDLSFKNAGKIVEIDFDEGMRVKKGEVLARQDVSELEVQKTKLEQVLLYTKSLISQAEVNLEFQRANHQIQMRLVAGAIAAARARLDEAVNGNREEQIAQAQAISQKAQIEYDNMSQEYKRHEKLLASNAISTQTFDTVKTQYLATEQQLLSSREQYNLLKAGSRKETIELMKAGLAQAEAQKEEAESLVFQIRNAACALDSLRQDLEVKKADIDLVKVKIGDAVLYAPEDGIILEKFSELSEVIGSGSPIGVMANMNEVWVRGYIAEEDLGRVKPGAPAVVLSDTYPGKAYPGYVAFVSPEAEFTPKNVQTKRERVKLVYRVKINVDNASGELRLGMPVDASISCKQGEKAHGK